MLLASVDAVRTELTFDDVTEVDNAILGALKAASAVLARKLRTDFDFASYTDTFMVPPNHAHSAPQPLASNLFASPRVVSTQGLLASTNVIMTQLHLNHGFLTSTSLTDLTVKTSQLFAHFSDGNSNNISDIRVFPADGLDHIIPDTEAGLIYLSQVDVRGLFVQVEYTAGFTVASDDVYDDVPFWLEEAAILHTQIMLDKNPVIRRPEGAESQISALLTQFNTIIDEKVRYHPAAVKPLGR